MGFTKRIAATALAALAAFGLITTPATADTVVTRWTCINPFGGINGSWDFRITVTAPATATVGQTATLTASFYNTVPRGSHVAAGTFTGQLEIAVGGAGSGLVYANGLSNPDTQPDQPLGLDGGHAQYTYSASGSVTFKPQVIRIFRNGVAVELCGSNNTPIAATTRVSL